MELRTKSGFPSGTSAEFTPNDLTLSRRRNPVTGVDQWTASVTLRVPASACARARTASDAVGIDFGLIHWANLDDGSQIENPRWLREALPRLAELQRLRARKNAARITTGSCRSRSVGCISGSPTDAVISSTSKPRPWCNAAR